MTSRQPDRRSKRVRDWSITVGALALMTGAALAGPAAGPSADPLRAGFETPPNAARPRVWWHWMDGNVALDGAKLDLEWMQRIGIGGVHTFSGGGLGGKPMVAHPQPFMSAGWRDVFRETTRIAHDAGMEVSIAGSPGWSQTGGVWVAPRDAMKKYVWGARRGSRAVNRSTACSRGRPPRPGRSRAWRRSIGERVRSGSRAIFTATAS